MKRHELLILVAVVAVAGGLIAFLRMRGRLQESPQPAPATPATAHPAAPAPAAPQPVTPKAPEPVPMAFARDGLADKIATEVERVVGKGKAKVAIQPRDGGHWVCILADGPGRYGDFDEGLTLKDFPGLEAAGFGPAPPPVARNTTSIYRSYAMKAMGYDAARGDRVILLLCPQADWPQLPLHWPAPTTK